MSVSIGDYGTADILPNNQILFKRYWNYRIPEAPRMVYLPIPI